MSNNILVLNDYWTCFQLLSHLPALVTCLRHPYTAVRHMTSRVLAMLAKLATASTVNHVLQNVVPLLGASDADTERQGAIEALASILCLWAHVIILMMSCIFLCFVERIIAFDILHDSETCWFFRYKWKVIILKINYCENVKKMHSLAQILLFLLVNF